QTASLGLGPPDYEVDEAGPDHAKRFTARARVAGEVLGEGSGGSKKEAEQLAAAAAFKTLESRQGTAGVDRLDEVGEPGAAAPTTAASASASASASETAVAGDGTQSADVSVGGQQAADGKATAGPVDAGA
nr:putative dsRNA-binding protein [Micromonospora sp. DSM 115978]